MPPNPRHRAHYQAGVIYLPPQLGIKKGQLGFMVLRVRLTPTRFPNSVSYAPLGNIPCIQRQMCEAFGLLVMFWTNTPRINNTEYLWHGGCTASLGFPKEKKYEAIVFR